MVEIFVCAAILCCLNLWVGFQDFSLSLCDHYAFGVQVGTLFSNQIILYNALRSFTQFCCWCHFLVEKFMYDRGKRSEAFIDAASILVFHSFFLSLQVTCTTLSHIFSLSLSLFSQGALDLEYNPQVHIWDAKSCMNKWKTVRRNRNWPKMQVWLCVRTLYAMQQIYLVSVLSGLPILPPYPNITFAHSWLLVQSSQNLLNFFPLVCL